jgi:MFS family permease
LEKYYPPATHAGSNLGRVLIFKRTSRIPRYAGAVLQALQFFDADTQELHALDEGEWKRLLEFCDAAQLTLLLGSLCGASLPGWVQVRIERNYKDNAARFRRLKSAVVEISEALTARSIDFAYLKGFAHSPAFTPDPLLRAQGDIDIWCLPERVQNAKQVLIDLGYRPIARSSGRHLDPMVRESHWTWRGDFFDPALPIPVDLHYQLWDEELERIPGLHEQEIWDRRSTILLDNDPLPTLMPADTIAFAALHLMMHLFHGDLRLQRAWELAYALFRRANDEQFWADWQRLHPAESRKLQVVAFLLADHWFGCGLSKLIQEEAELLNADVTTWIARYGLSPIEALFVTNKDELWLNLCLLNSFTSKRAVFCRRVLPIGSAVKNATLNGGSQPLASTRALRFLVHRALKHSRAFIPTCVQAVRWWWLRKQLGRDFFAFLSVSVLFDFGEFIFFLLYNLYLLDLGKTERFLGQVSAAVTAGTFIGVIPVAAVTRRVGLRKAVLIAIIGTAAATTLRAVVIWEPVLLLSAFLNGLFMCFWAVSLPPAVAGLTNSRNRTFAFSLIASMGIGIGGLAGLLGGRLPGFFTHLLPYLPPVRAKRIALIVGSAVAALAALPGLSLAFPNTPVPEPRKKMYPRSKFAYSFLIALFIWSIGTGGFNPFFNAYFSRHLHASVETIGSVFSYGQLTQVFVILLAPAVLRKTGEIRGIAYMQLATATMLALLAFTAFPMVAAFVYVAYVCFQYMSEPCLLSMLMTRVEPAEQSGASAMNFMVIAAAGILASMVAGAMFSSYGYRATLTACAIATAIAAALFYCLFRPGAHK